MSLFISSLNSGSNANCYYIANHDEAILVDAGLSCRETEKRLINLGLSISKIKAIFISHEHSDHIKGLAVISKKYSIPVYITPKTALGFEHTIPEALLNFFIPNQPTQIGQLEVLAFQKRHDAVDPHSFMISNQNTKIGVITDIGDCCENVVKYFKQCNAVFLETNYDEEILNNGSYPYHLKQRIKGGHGHLSNQKALELFINHRSTGLSHLFLSHLSKENNNPELVMELFKNNTEHTKIILASRHQETEVYQID